jgi:hypothetical protein
LEESAGAGGGLPAGGRDFDKLAFGIGEVEEDLGGQEAGARGRGPGAGNGVSLGGQAAATAASDTAPDGEALVLEVVVGLGFQVIEERVEGAGGWQCFELGEEFMEEPLAVGAGADGEDVETFGGGGIEANEGLAVGGGEGNAAVGDGDEGSEGIWHECLLILI